MCKSTVFASEVYNTDARGNFLDADFMRHSRDNQTRLSERNAFLSPGGDVQYSHSHDRVAIRYRNVPFSPAELSIVSPTCSLFSLVLYTVLPPTSTLPGYTPSDMVIFTPPAFVMSRCIIHNYCLHPFRQSLSDSGVRTVVDDGNNRS